MKKVLLIFFQVVLALGCVVSIIIPNVLNVDKWIDVFLNILSVVFGSSCSASISLSVALNINSNNKTNKKNSQKAGRESFQFQIGEINNGK